MKTRNKGFVFVLLMLLPSLLFSQEFEEFIKQREQEKQQFARQREKALKELEQQRADYIRKLQKEYTAYLKKRWEEYRVFAGKQMPDESEPVVQPEFNKEEQFASGKISITPKAEEKDKKHSVDLPVIHESGESHADLNRLSVDFYGAQLNLPYDPQMVIQINEKPGEQVIGNLWENVNNTQFTPLLDKCLAAKDRLQLNDWGYYLLLKNVCNELTSSSTNASRFLQWFFLVKSGYKAKMGYRGNNLFLLLPTSHELYQIPYLTLNNIKYYIMDGTGEGNIHTYEKDYPEARRLIDMTIPKAVQLPRDNSKRSVKVGDKSYTISYNNNVIEFYQDFPLMDLSVYFNSAVSNPTKQSMISTLKPEIENKSKEEAVSFLLEFVQNLPYKSDQEQFNEEKFFFAEEVFHYKYSDCEDRSVLFSYLVNELLDIKTAGLVYPGHVATALQLDKAVSGRYINLEGNRYVICDPTYKNAPIGTLMPEYADQEAKLVQVDNRNYRTQRSERIWAQIQKSGGEKGSNSGNMVYDKKGNAYVTGYFSGEFEMGSFHFRSTEQSKDIFYAKFDKDNHVDWVKHIEGTGSDIGTRIQMDDQNNLYITGTFHEQLKSHDNSLQAKDLGDVFLAKCDVNGNIEWMDQLNIQHIQSDENLRFAAKFTPNGKLNWKRMYKESESYTSYDISFDEHRNVMVSGALYSTAGLRMKTMSYSSYADFNAVNSLKEQHDKLIEDQYDPSIAGLFAVIDLIENTGILLKGDDVQKALDKYNPRFKQQSPNIYENIGKVDFLKNDEGIVTIKTKDQEKVKFSNMRVENNAQLKVVTYQSGNAKVDMLSGVKVGKAFVWYDLNHIKLHKKTGDLLFVYDDDHSRKEIAMREILE